jgi:hypothetical protein
MSERRAIWTSGSRSSASDRSRRLPPVFALKDTTSTSANPRRKAELDVLELLGANPNEPLARVREVCKQHRLGTALDRVLAGQARRG